MDERKVLKEGCGCHTIGNSDVSGGSADTVRDTRNKAMTKREERRATTRKSSRKHGKVTSKSQKPHARGPPAAPCMPISVLRLRRRLAITWAKADFHASISWAFSATKHSSPQPDKLGTTPVNDQVRTRHDGTTFHVSWCLYFEAECRWSIAIQHTRVVLDVVLILARLVACLAEVHQRFVLDTNGGHPSPVMLASQTTPGKTHLRAARKTDDSTLCSSDFSSSARLASQTGPLDPHDTENPQ